MFKTGAAIAIVAASIASAAAPSETVEHWGAYEVHHLPLPGAATGILALTNGTIVVPSSDDQVYFMRADGRMIGQVHAGHVIDSPVLMRDGTIAVAVPGQKTSQVFFLSSDGRKLGEFETKSGYLTLTALRDGTLAVGIRPREILFLNSRGRVVRRLDADAALLSLLGETKEWSYIAHIWELKDGRLLVGSTDGRYIVSRDLKTVRRWTLKVFPLLVMRDGSILALNSFGAILVNAEGRILKQFDAPDHKQFIGDAAEFRDGFAMGNGRGNLYVFQRNGQSWHFKTGGGISRAPIQLRDGTVVASSQDHKLYFLSSSGALLGRYLAETEIVQIAELADGTLAAVGRGESPSPIVELANKQFVSVITPNTGPSHNLYIFTPTGRPFANTPSVVGRSCRTVGLGWASPGIEKYNFSCGESERIIEYAQSDVEQNCITHYPDSRPVHCRLVECKLLPASKPYPAMSASRVICDCEICQD